MMKKIFSFSSYPASIIQCTLIMVVFLFSCAKDTEIGAPLPVTADYPLPQGNASQAANDKIQHVYDAYGSYLLYEFTQKDFDWSIASGSANSNDILAVKGAVEYVEDMVDLLQETWFRFFSDDFLRGKGIPYRVFMADTIKQPRAPGAYSPMQRNELFYAYRVTGMSIAFTGMNQDLRTMTPESKKNFKNVIQSIVWRYYFDKSVFDFTNLPDEFDALADYTTAVTVAAAPARGFIPQFTPPGSKAVNLDAPVSFAVVSTNWFQSATTRTKANDVFAYVTQMVQKTEAELQPLFDVNPVIKQKYDIIRLYFRSKYGIDLQEIGNS
jgi:hypothetical protein